MSGKLDLDGFVDDVKRATGNAIRSAQWTKCSPGRFRNPPVAGGDGEPRVPGLSTLYRADDRTILNVSGPR